MNNENTQGDFFFWLGPDAEFLSLNKTDFNDKVKDELARQDNYYGRSRSNGEVGEPTGR